MGLLFALSILLFVWSSLLNETRLRRSFFCVATEALKFAKQSFFAIIFLPQLLITLQLLFLLFLFFFFTCLLFLGFLLCIHSANLLGVLLSLFIVLLKLTFDSTLSDGLSKVFQCLIRILEGFVIATGGVTTIIFRLLIWLFCFVLLLFVLANDAVDGALNVGLLLDELRRRGRA